MRKARVILLLGLIFLLVVVSAAPAGVWRVKVRPGVMVGEEAASDFYVDAFVPVAGDNDTVLFMNYIYRFGTNESQEWNLGLGLRQMWRSWILGGVLYYDWLSSSLGNHYDQVTLALEALSNRYFDARLNFYLPMGRHVTKIEDREVVSGYVFSGRGLWEVYERMRRYEEAAKGVEFEVGRLSSYPFRLQRHGA
ncbi:inverse autotransporter beta domain-containing protein [Thermosulfurimonas sp. F29]|uniref:inverse autotransporter beta domain-containing protein n=1 Tax=Thermosulfurimonas sp. F29 TaxID=2867247 RepID=UPI001C8360C3|nr:inverse autotransporter beta domain-containing protein [Thermosulfurimonas sp. F29]MBX6422867.1 inverse autotransporter beta domain-containing protein [Thermosulfurimonas sp. F29]